MATDALDVDDLVLDLKNTEDFVLEDKNFDSFKTNSTHNSIKKLNEHNQDHFPDVVGSTQTDGKNIKNVLNDPFGGVSKGDSLSKHPFADPPSQNTAFNNDPFGDLGSTDPTSKIQIPDPFSNNNEVKDPFQDLEGNLTSLSVNQNEIDNLTNQESTDKSGVLMGDPFPSKKFEEIVPADPFGTGLDPIGSTDPFGTAKPTNISDPFGTGLDPIRNTDPFGAALDPVNNADPFGTGLDPVNNTDPFGTVKPTDISDPFGTGFGPINNTDAFGTGLDPVNNTDPFGTGLDPVNNTEPFGTGLDPINNTDPFGTTKPTDISDPFGTGVSNPPSNEDPFGIGPNAVPISDPFGTKQDQGKNGTNLLENGSHDPFGENFSSVNTTGKVADPFQDLGSIQTLGNTTTNLFGADFAGSMSKKDESLKDADPFSAVPFKSQSTFPDSTEIQPHISELSQNESNPSNVKVLNYDDIFGDDPFHASSNDQSKVSSNNLNSQSNQSTSIHNSDESKFDPEIEAAFNHSENLSNINDFIADKPPDITSQSGTNFIENTMNFEQPMTTETKGVENPDLLKNSLTNNVLNQLDQNKPIKAQDSYNFPSAGEPNNEKVIPVNQPAGDQTTDVTITTSLPDVLPSLGLPDLHASSHKQKSEEVGVSISDVPLDFDDDDNNKNRVEAGMVSQEEVIEDSVDLSVITTSLKDQKDEDESEFEFDAPVVPVPTQPAPVTSSKPVPARPAPLSPMRPAPIAPGTKRAAPIAPITNHAAPVAPITANIDPTPVQPSSDKPCAPVAPMRVKRASMRDTSANIPDNTPTQLPLQSSQADGVKPAVITSTVEDWDNIQTIQPGFKSEIPPEGDQTINKSTPLYTYEEAYKTLQQADYTMVQNSLRTSVDRSGITAVVHFLFGPPKLNRDLIKGREFVFCLSASCLDNEQPSHSKMLQSIYRILTGSRFDSPRIGSHWEEVGFQGSDPGTDLRGVGILGLVQLLYFLQHSKYGQIARDIYKLSLHPTQNFPFCVMGINISRICLQSLREDYLNKEINKRKDVMSVVNEFYIGSYYYLYNLWKQGKTIADSGFVLKDVEAFAKKHTKDVFRNLETYKTGGEATQIKTEGQEEFFSVCKE